MVLRSCRIGSACLLAIFLTCLAAHSVYAQDSAHPGNEAGRIPVIGGGAGYVHNLSGAATTFRDQVFAVNCGRCHQPPMGLSPRVTGTVIMHARTPFG